ncbi:hypothetical protein [Butyrivibrio sp. NC2007]|uniref:hypothetical protein n=1 Tax=Butyrivibrio sp. NC2007 TaxID=1280683 RepID=UPI0003B70680|nr:hypothetical protein [Butyrivibrio sp. NC2007]
MERKDRELGVDDQVYFWFSSGNQSCTVEWGIELKEEIEEEKLRQAVLSAMKDLPVFRSHFVVSKGRVKAFIEDNIEKVPVFAEDNKLRRFGTADTYGYLFYLSFNKKSLVYHEFHAMTDGTSIHVFLKTIMMYYLSETKGVQVDKTYLSDVGECVLMTESVLKSNADSDSKGDFVVEDHAEEVFHFPIELFKESDRKWRYFEIDLPIAPLLSLAKSYNSSVVPLLESMIGNAIRSNFEVGEKIIVGHTPVDMRRIFGIKTMSNGTTTAALPYGPMMDKLAPEDRAALLRKILKNQIQPENICGRLKTMLDEYLQMDSQPYSIEQIISGLQWIEKRNKTRSPYTYALSYMGKVHYSDEIDKYIEAVRGNTVVKTVPVMIVASENAGVLHLIITQMFEGDELVRSIYNELVSIIPETKYLDRGVRFFDKLDLEELEHFDE